MLGNPKDSPFNAPISSLVPWLEQQQTIEAEVAIQLIGQYFRERAIVSEGEVNEAYESALQSPEFCQIVASLKDEPDGTV